jgi:hypothetical protein
MNNDQIPSSYDYVALPDRRPLSFPNGARLAVILTINLEYWEKFRPGQQEPLFTGGPMTIPHALPGDVGTPPIGRGANTVSASAFGDSSTYSTRPALRLPAR